MPLCDLTQDHGDCMYAIRVRAFNTSTQNHMPTQVPHTLCSPQQQYQPTYVGNRTSEQPSVNVKGSKLPAHCKPHAGHGLKNVPHTRCPQDACTRQPSYHIEGNKNAAYCMAQARHGMRTSLSVAHINPARGDQNSMAEATRRRCTAKRSKRRF